MINYFNIMGIEQGVFIDKTMLQKNYISLQSKFHPDKHINASEVQKMEVLQQSSDVNKAFKVLSDDVLRLEHLLLIHGVDIQKIIAVKDVLLEQMELNEAILEASAEDRAKIIASLKHRIEDSFKKAEKFYLDKNFKGLEREYLNIKYLGKLTS